MGIVTSPAAASGNHFVLVFFCEVFFSMTSEADFRLIFEQFLIVWTMQFVACFAPAHFNGGMDILPSEGCFRMAFEAKKRHILHKLYARPVLWMSSPFRYHVTLLTSYVKKNMLTLCDSRMATETELILSHKSFSNR